MSITLAPLPNHMFEPHPPSGSTATQFIDARLQFDDLSGAVVVGSQADDISYRNRVCTLLALQPALAWHS